MDTLKVFYVQAVVAALALCIVHEGHEARQIGYRLESMRRETESRVVEAQKCTAQIGRLKSPQRILHLVEALELDIEQAPVTGELADAAGAPAADGETSPPPVAVAEGVER